MCFISWVTQPKRISYGQLNSTVKGVKVGECCVSFKQPLFIQ